MTHKGEGHSHVDSGSGRGHAHGRGHGAVGDGSGGNHTQAGEGNNLRNRDHNVTQKHSRMRPDLNLVSLSRDNDDRPNVVRASNEAPTARTSSDGGPTPAERQTNIVRTSNEAPTARTSGDGGPTPAERQTNIVRTSNDGQTERPTTTTGRATSSGGDGTGRNLDIPPVNYRQYGELRLSQLTGDPQRPGEPPEGTDPRRDSPERVSANGLDKAKSIAELIQSGRFIDAIDRTRTEPGIENNEAPKIRIVYQDHSNTPNAPKPDFIVDKDGKIQVVHNPEGPPSDKEIVVQVAREKGYTGAPPPDQQKAVDELVSYLGDRVIDQYGDKLKTIKTPSGDIKQVDIADLQNLVSDKVEQRFGNQLPPDVAPPSSTNPQVPDSVRPYDEGMSRGGGSGGGSQSFNRGAFDRSIPSRDGTPVPTDVVPPVQAMEDTAAAMFEPNKDKPYQTVKHVEGMGFRVGRYGFNQQIIGDWMLPFLDPELLALLGNPPDWSKLAKILKENPNLMKGFQQGMQKAMAARGKELHDQADQAGNDQLHKSAQAFEKLGENFGKGDFAGDFAKFVSDMGGGGDPVTADRVNQFLPKELQETMAKDTVNRFAKQIVADGNPDHMTKQDAGKIALAMFLGRVPDAQDMQNPSYQRYAQAGENFYQLARAGQFGTGDLDITEVGGRIIAAARNSVGKPMWAQSPFAGWTENGNLGCAASVSEVLQNAGYNYANSALAAGLADQLRAKGWTMQRATEANLVSGAVIYGYSGNPYSGGGNAHIGIVGERTNGQTWIYDNSSRSRVWEHRPIQNTSFTLRNNDRFGDNIYVLIPPSRAA